MRRHRLVIGGLALGIGAGVWARRNQLANWATDGLARRPSGWVARRFYRDAKQHQDSFRAVLDALELSREDRLLEVGCGGGTFLDWALETGCRAKAVDHSPEMLELAGQRNARAIADGRLALQQSEAEQLPFPDGEFTAAASMNAFFFFYDPDAVLAEVNRTLVPGGRLAIHTAATAYMAPPPIARRMRFYDDDELRSMLERAGFEDIEVRRSGPRDSMQLVTARRWP